MGLRHETEGGEEGLEAFQDWSQQHDSCDYIKTMDAWLSFEGEGRTARAILREARRRKWKGKLGHERRPDEAEQLIDECWTEEESATKYQEALDEQTRADIEALVGIPSGSAFFKLRPIGLGCSCRLASGAWKTLYWELQ